MNVIFHRIGGLGEGGPDGERSIDPALLLAMRVWVDWPHDASQMQQASQHKDGKLHRYWSVIESYRLAALAREAEPALGSIKL